MLECVIIEPQQQPARHAVIWLHGLGADGHDFEPIVAQLQLPQQCAVRFIFPHAPLRPVTLNNGFTMRAWFDIFGLQFGDRQDSEGIANGEKMIVELVQREIKNGINCKNIMLAGFSQGGALALHTGLRYPEKLGGILALSCYLPLHDQLKKEAASANHHTSIFMAHGSYDPVLNSQLGEWSYQYLKELNYPVQWHAYPMEHSVCDLEVADIRKWMLEIFN